MDATRIPGQLPATITRPRPLIEAVMAQSLCEQGPGSRTAAAWRWVLTGHGPAPVSDTPGTGHPPGLDDITAEARHGDGTQWKRWPPWRNAFDHDSDRQQARRVLRWLTGAADAIPLLDLDRGQYVGARLYFARTDDELRQVRGWARTASPSTATCPPTSPDGKPSGPGSGPRRGSTPPGSAAPSPTWTGYSATPTLTPVTRQPKPISSALTSIPTSSQASAKLRRRRWPVRHRRRNLRLRRMGFIAGT